MSMGRVLALSMTWLHARQSGGNVAAWGTIADVAAAVLRLDFARPKRCTSADPDFALLKGEHHARLPQPYLRRPELVPRGPDRSAGGLGAPRARPRRRALHRPARPLRHDAGAGRQRQPGLRRHREAEGRDGGP